MNEQFLAEHPQLTDPELTSLPVHAIAEGSVVGPACGAEVGALCITSMHAEHVDCSDCLKLGA